MLASEASFFVPSPIAFWPKTSPNGTEPSRASVVRPKKQHQTPVKTGQGQLAQLLSNNNEHSVPPTRLLVCVF